MPTQIIGYVILFTRVVSWQPARMSPRGVGRVTDRHLTGERLLHHWGRGTQVTGPNPENDNQHLQLHQRVFSKEKTNKVLKKKYVCNTIWYNVENWKGLLTHDGVPDRVPRKYSLITEPRLSFPQVLGVELVAPWNITQSTISPSL